MYECIETLVLPFSDLIRPYKNKIVISEGEKWELENKEDNIYKLSNNTEWIKISEWQLKKYFKKISL